MDTQHYIDLGIEYAIQYGPKVLLAIIILFIGLKVIGMFGKYFTKTLEKSKVDKSLSNFLTGLITVVLKIALFISVLTMFGVATTSFVAVLGAMAFAVGMALQGSLGNFAGGVLIMLFKPFKIGDVITAQDHTGKVKDIDIFVTKILTPQNRLVIIPNGPLAGGNIVNLTAEEYLRVDITIGIGYGEDIKYAREVLMKVMTDHPKVLNDPAPAVNVKELADSSVNLLLTPYAKTEDFWTVNFDLIENAKLALDAANIEIPYPHSVEIHKEG